MTKYFVRNADGELEVSSYAQLRTLYARQFIGDSDEVRREGTDRWVKAGSMPDLIALKPRKWHGSEFAWIFVGISLISIVLIALTTWLKTR